MIRDEAETLARIKRPLAVGETHVFVVGVEGVIDAVDSETVTINGITLPRCFNHERGVRYLSLLWPENPDVCHRDHCGDNDCPGSSHATAGASLEQIERLVTHDHDLHHDGPMRFCGHLACREVRGS